MVFGWEEKDVFGGRRLMDPETKAEYLIGVLPNQNGVNEFFLVHAKAGYMVPIGEIESAPDAITERGLIPRT